MNCPSTETIESFLEGLDTGPDHSALEQHLCDCDACRDILRQMTETSPFPQDDTLMLESWSDEVANRMAKRLDIATERHAADTAFRLPFAMGNYELRAVIGQGGMGTVYLARQLSLNRTVAVKMIVRQFLKPSLVNRFYVEARSAALLDHPGIVPVYDVGQFGAYVYFAMAHVPGGTLADRLQEGPIDARHAAELLKNIAQAVHFAHMRGVIHRDLKPSNILLEGDGQTKVADFGLAKLIESGVELTASGEILGTPGYMPPEQAGGPGGVTVTSDVYGLGAILCHLLAGRPPFSGPEPAGVLYQVVHEEPSPQFRADVSRDLRTITLKCLAKRPSDRYESAAEVARELERFLEGRPIEARPLGQLEHLVRWYRRRPAVALMTFATLAAVVGGSAFSAYFGLLAHERANRVTESNFQLTLAELDSRRSANEAELQAAIATEHADGAMQMLELALYDLQDVVTDDPTEQQERKQLLDSVLRGLDDLQGGAISAERLLRCRAYANLGVADVMMQMGNDAGQTGVAASRESYVAAIEQFQSLLDADPNNLTSAGDFSNAVVAFADTLAEAGQWREANDLFQKALPIREQRATVFPDDPTIQGQLAELEIFCGEGLTFTGQPMRGKEMFIRARDRCDILVERFPDDVYIRGELVHACQELGDWYVLQSDTDAAETNFLRMNKEVTRLTAFSPGDTENMMSVSTSLERLGDISLARGELTESLERYLESLDIARAIGRTAPQNDKVQWDVSFGYQKVADAYLRLGDARAAREAALSCVEVRRRLAVADPQNAHLHAKLFHALTTLARSCEGESDFSAAQRWHEELLRFAVEFNAATGTDRFTPLVQTAKQKIEHCRRVLAADKARGLGDAAVE